MLFLFFWGEQHAAAQEPRHVVPTVTKAMPLALVKAIAKPAPPSPAFIVHSSASRNWAEQPGNFLMGMAALGFLMLRAGRTMRYSRISRTYR